VGSIQAAHTGSSDGLYRSNPRPDRRSGAVHELEGSDIGKYLIIMEMHKQVKASFKLRKY